MSLATESRVLAGRYQLTGKLGVGGAAEVHRGWDVLLRRFVAVKVVTGEGDERRFDNEVRTLAGLSHPGLLSVYDVGADGGTSFVVMQLVEGTTLRDRLVAGAFTPAQVRALGHQLADTLAHVHEQRVVHRDVKPSNILLDGSDTAFLADFGLARSLGSAPVTKTRAVVGTASYLAPEQVRGEEVGPPADVYALGLVLLECLTGYREYQGDRVEAAVARLHRPPLIPHDVPAGLSRLLAAMTSLSAHRRPTAAQVADRLRPAPTALPPDRLLCGVRHPTAPPTEALPA
ncbi:serine/threonine-protein kinase [Actinosynnema sp. NPDC091369]